MKKIPRMTFSHMGLYCFDLEKMTDFYTRIMCLAETDRGVLPAGVKIVFLSGEPKDHHQLVLVEGRTADLGSALVNQVSFRLDSLATLRELDQAVQQEGITQFRYTNHCISWSLYFPDPEGNRIEAFVDAPFYVNQPIVEPLDLAQSDEDILHATEKKFRNYPSFKSLSDWRSAFAQKLGLAP